MMNSNKTFEQVEIARVTCEKERRHREKEVSEIYEQEGIKMEQQIF